MLSIKSENIMFSTDVNEFANPEVVYGARSNGSCTSQACSDAQLFSALCEIDKHNYLYLFERCKAFKVNARQLRYLEKEHIRRIIPPDQIGVLAEFEYMHTEWKRQYMVPATTIGVAAESATATTKVTAISEQTGTNTPVTVLPKILNTASATKEKIPPPLRLLPEAVAAAAKVAKTSMDTRSAASAVVPPCKKRIKVRSSPSPSLKEEESEEDQTSPPTSKTNTQHMYTLEKIIQNDLRKVKAQYKKNGFLVERDRRLLASVLVEYFRDHKIYMSRDIMESLAVQISEVFPTESKNAWHDVTARQRRRGRLCLKLYNTQRTKRATTKTYRKHLKETYGIKKSDADESTQEETAIEEDDTDAQRIQVWIKENKWEDNDELMQMWYETTEYRMKQMKRHECDEYASTGAHINEILENWPSYKTDVGNVLISIDFNNLHPHSEGTFYERWPVFLQKAVKLSKADIKDAICCDLFNQYERMVDSLKEDTKQVILVQLFHAIMRPTRPIHARQSARRYAVAESQSAFCRVISDLGEMEDYAAPFPYIFILGTTFDVKRCFVAFGAARYEMSFVDAIYTCFQIFMVFKLHFPLPAMNFWTFVKLYFFDITPEAGINISVVETVIKYMLAN